MALSIALLSAAFASGCLQCLLTDWKAGYLLSLGGTGACFTQKRLAAVKSRKKTEIGTLNKAGPFQRR